MIDGVLRGKVSLTEDALTSIVFGVLARLPWEQGLGAWTALARRLDGEALGLIDQARPAFWPVYPLGDGTTCEPDVVLGELDCGGVLVECKLWSGPSGLPDAADDTALRGQLGRQWVASGASCRLVYLTSHAAMPRALMAEMVREVEAKTAHQGFDAALYWLSWRQLPTLLPGDDGIGEASLRGLVDDVRRVLEHAGLVPFTGMEPIRPVALPWRYTYGFDRTSAPPQVDWGYPPRGGAS